MGGSELAFADLLDNSESQTSLRGEGQSGGDGLVTSGGAGLVVVPHRPSGDSSQCTATRVLLRVWSAPPGNFSEMATRRPYPHPPTPVNTQKL